MSTLQESVVQYKIAAITMTILGFQTTNEVLYDVLSQGTSKLPEK